MQVELVDLVGVGDRRARPRLRNDVWVDRAREHRQHVVHVLVAGLGALLEASQHEARAPRGHFGGDLSGVGRRLREVGAHHLEQVAPGKRHLVGQGLERGHPERVDVGAQVGAASLGLLGRHVQHGPDDVLGPGEDPRDQVVLELGDAEVQQLHDQPARAVLPQQDVRWLDVAVHDPAVVGSRQRSRDLAQHRERVRPVQSPGPLEVRREVLAFEELHRDEEQSLGCFPIIEDVDDVRMVDEHRRFRLAEEAMPKHLADRSLGLEQLERDSTSRRQVHAVVDVAHRARPDETRRAVAVVQNLP